MLISALLLTPMLSACGSAQQVRAEQQARAAVANTARASVDDLREGCADPGVRAGRPALVELDRNRSWARCERRRGDDLVVIFDQTVTTMAGDRTE